LFALLLSVFHMARFSMFLIPFYALMAVQLLASISRARLRPVARRSWLAPVVVALLTMWTFGESYQFNRKKIGSGPKEILSIAQWFENKLPASQREGTIVARKPHIAYYLGLDFVWMPHVGTYEELIAELHRVDADFMYFSPVEALWRPELAFLANPRSSHPGLTALLHLEDTNASAVLYKVDGKLSRPE